MAFNATKPPLVRKGRPRNAISLPAIAFEITRLLHDFKALAAALARADAASLAAILALIPWGAI
jgi:hypothetical protein